VTTVEDVRETIAEKRDSSATFILEKGKTVARR
jgi:hypothetical protein